MSIYDTKERFSTASIDMFLATFVLSCFELGAI